MMLPTLPRPQAILFDWDNTLADNWGTIQVALNAARTAMGFPAWSLEETRRRVRASMRDSFPRMFGDRWPEARDIFYATYRASHLDTLKPLPLGEAGDVRDRVGHGAIVDPEPSPEHGLSVPSPCRRDEALRGDSAGARRCARPRSVSPSGVGPTRAD